ncbi:HesB/IscA family protein [Rhodovibrio salinarum]|nr:iron-sulfur cluster assembly accessory protein [Rhodovibrio salinarum]
MLTLTDAARETLEAFVAKSQRARGLRIVARTGGCIGMQYRLGLDIGPEAEDTVATFGALEIYLDPDSAGLLRGAMIDFVQDARGAGFVFDNPNAAGLCSCAAPAQ